MKPENIQKNTYCSGCFTCQEWTQLVLDQEANCEQIAYVQQHMAECPNCADCFAMDKALREAVKCKCGKEIPTDLWLKVRERLAFD